VDHGTLSQLGGAVRYISCVEVIVHICCWAILGAVLLVERNMGGAAA